MDTQAPTTPDFMEQFTIGLTVKMVDSDNEGLPTMNVYVIPVGTESQDLDKVDAKRLLLTFNFSGDGTRMRFYGPNGESLIDTQRDGDPGKDTAINAKLTEAWQSGEEFMPAMQNAVMQTVSSMLAATALAMGDPDINPQDALDMLLQMRTGVKVYRDRSDEEVGNATH